MLLRSCEDQRTEILHEICSMRVGEDYHVRYIVCEVPYSVFSPAGLS